MPSILNSALNTLEGLLNCVHILPNSKIPLRILDDVSGVIKPGRMTLLLGPPSSGKTTLLLALAGNLDNNLKVSGKVTYDGHEMEEFVAQRCSAYISQYDLHIPEMTVRETLAFSARCQGAGINYNMLVELLRREKEANIKPNSDIDIYMKAAALGDQEHNVVIDYILKILGLEACADTLVGNQMIRGISGGERKRLTTGEMLVGPARVFFMDEISTGLDTSTTFQIINAIRQSVHILHQTVVISLLQPAPEVNELFDDVILLSDGQITYQGPTENVLEFFEFMGFKCPKRKAVADYLQEVTSRREQEQYWMHEDVPYRFVTPKEFAKAFRTFHVGKKLDAELVIPFDEKKHQHSLATKTYGVGKKDLFKACMSREYLLMKRNSFVHLFKMAQMTLMAVITITVFSRAKMSKTTLVDGRIYMGSLFLGIIRLLFSGLEEIGITVSQLPVYYKQRELLFYPSWAYSLPKWILKIPISIIEVAIWVSITYYGTGYDPDPYRFFRQCLVFLLLHQMASALFRFIAGVGRDMITAYALGITIFSTFMVLGGFILSQDYLKPWWIWGYWFSPLMYAQNAVNVNEFLGKSWSHVPANCTEPLGVQVLKSRGIFTGSCWYSIGVVALVGFCVLFNLLFMFALTYLNPTGKSQAVVETEDMKEENSRRKSHPSLQHSMKKTATEKSVEMRRVEIDNQERKRGMVLPFEPLSITFDDIRYAIDTPEKMKKDGANGERLELLKGVSGAFRPGILTALMGISGAGKTTLMDVLAGRKTAGYIQGTITISGYPKKQEKFARVSGYVEQNDIHSPYVTVYESLLFSAWLRLSPNVDSVTRKMFIWEVMELVELASIKDALVGLPGVNGLSTEQRKRLTIAVELVANPSIIFMDEPTSGLDARAAAIVMRTVKNTVNTGRTVVCTIHQPSIDIFDTFDELLLLKQGGEQIYFGALGPHACHLIKYFEAIDGIKRIKDGQNPSTWMMEITSATQEAKLGVNLAEIYKNSNLHRNTKSLIIELSSPAPGSKDLYFSSKYSETFASQFLTCLWKQHWMYWRNTEYNFVRLFLAGFLGISIGSMFWNLGRVRRREQDVFNAMGSMFATILFLGVRNSASVQPVVSVERTIFYRERAAGMYSALAYALAQVVIEIPYCIAQTVIYGCIVYFMMGFERTTAKFFWFIYFTFFTLLYFTYYGMMVVAISPNHTISTVTSSLFYNIWDLFSGFVIPITRIPIWWRWYYWACPVAWSLYGAIVSQFGDVERVLEDGQTVKEFLRSYFEFRYEFLSVVACVITAFPVLFAFIFAYSIKALNFQRR